MLPFRSVARLFSRPFGFLTLVGVCLAASDPAGALTTYTWNLPGAGAWNVASNWTPTRTSPASDDIMVVDGKNATLMNVPTQTIGQLKLVNGAVVSLFGSSPGPVTLTLSGGAGTDLSVPAGTQLIVQGASTVLSVRLASATTGVVAGVVLLSGAGVQLTATDSLSLVVVSGGQIQNAGATTPFGSTALTSVVFQAGSSFVASSGGDAFGAAAPGSVCRFETGSLYSVRQSLLPSMSGRTFADLEINFASLSATAAGSSTCRIDSLTIRAGAPKIQLTDLHLRGNVRILPGASLSFNPAVAQTIHLDGTAPRTWSGDASFTANSTWRVENAAGLTLTNAFLSPSHCTISAGATLRVGTAAGFQNNGTCTVDGTLELDSGALLPGGLPFTYGAGGSLVFANTTTLGFASAAFWPVASGPRNVVLQGPGGVLFQAGLSLSVANSLTLNSGIIDVGTGSLVIGAGGSVVGGSAASHVKGSMVRTLVSSPISTVYNFPVGDGVVYAPLSLQFPAVSSGGAVTVSTTGGDHASIATSGLDGNASVNRHWNVTNSGASFAPATATLAYAPGDVDPGADPLQFVVRMFSPPSTWTAPTSSGQSATSITASGLASLGDLQIGTLLPPCGGTVVFGRTDFPTGVGPLDLALADLDEDGRLDLAVADYSGNALSILRGNGVGGFGGANTFAAGVNPVSMAIGDVNADGHLDLAVANWGGSSVSIFRGNGLGGFAAPTTLSASASRPIAARLARLDGDSALDLLVARWSAHDAWVMKGDGSGGFLPGASAPTNDGPYDVAIADLNQDGALDVVVAHRGFATTGNTISVLLGDGNGGFATHVDFAVGVHPSSVALGDVTGDHRIDAVVTNETDNTISILPGDGLGGFGARTDLATGSDPFCATIGDLNGDGRADIAVSNLVSGTVSVFLSNCAGGFLPRTDVAVGPSPRRIIMGDVNGDSRKDLLVADAVGNFVTVLRNFPAGTQVPSPVTSTVPATVTAGPNSNCCFDVVVRDAANNPISGSLVSVTFDSCAVAFCPVQPPGVQVVPGHLLVITDATGTAHVCACVNSQISACSVSIEADGIRLANHVLASSCASDSACAPNTWRALATTLPGARFSTALASNFDDQSILLFGGENASGYLGDTWRWDGFSWLQLSPSQSPSARSSFAMTYDRHRRRIVLFGGLSGSGPLSDTWEFDGANWSNVSNAGPSARFAHAMVFDEYRGKVVLFGGTNGGLLGDTWEWDGTTWVETTPLTSPTPRRDAAVAFDYSSGLTTLYGGDDGSGATSDTWVYASGFWMQLPAATPSPGARTLARMIYSAEGDALVLYGGAGPGADVSAWRLNGGKWNAWPSPLGVRVNHAMEYDHFNDHVILFGGRNQTVSNTGAFGDTREWCSPCPLVAAIEDTLGEVILPANADPYEWAVSEADSLPAQDTQSLHPEASIGNDLWPGQSPCALSFGGEADSVELEDPWTEEADSLGTDLTEAELADSMEVWDTRLAAIDSLNADEFPDSTMALRTYTPGPQRHCLDRTKKYAFGGRDIVFVHGLRTTPLKERMWSLTGSWVDWIPPNGKAGYIENPEYYDRYGYWKNGAINYWERHIQRFLRDRGYANRYLIVAWPATQHMKYGISAFLSQVSDAMIEGRGVVDLSGHNDSLNFGASSFVVVSHSTGGPLVSAGLSMARNDPKLHAQDVAAHAKAHVAIQGAFSGSHIASVSCGVSLALTALTPYATCRLIQAIWGDNGHICSDIVHFDTYLRGVTWDLMPRIMQSRWGPLFGSTPTVTLVGGHPTFQKAAKHLLLSGLDDGVVTDNSASANPTPVELWPGGYFRIGPKSIAGRAVKDLGINTKSSDGKKLNERSKGYYKDQIKFHNWVKSHGLWPFKDVLTWVAGGCTDLYSPTGMVQPPHLDPIPFFGDPIARYPVHMSFVECASDHFGMTPGYVDEDFEGNNEYKHTENRKGSEHNAEEVRVIFDPNIKQPYTVGPDHAPLLDVTNAVVTSGLATVEIPRFKCARHRKNGSCKRYKWYRSYELLAGWETNMAADYAYSYLLTQMPSDTCFLRPSVSVGAGPQSFFARNGQNPFSHDLSIEFQLSARAQVDLDVYDAQGRRIRKLTSARFEPGPHRLVWDSRSEAGDLVQPGLYFWRLRLNGERRMTEKAMLIR